MKLPTIIHLVDWIKNLDSTIGSSESNVMSIAQDFLDKEQNQNTNLDAIYSGINKDIVHISQEIELVHQSIESTNQLIENTIVQLKIVGNDVRTISE